MLLYAACSQVTLYSHGHVKQDTQAGRQTDWQTDTQMLKHPREVVRFWVEVGTRQVPQRNPPGDWILQCGFWAYGVFTLQMLRLNSNMSSRSLYGRHTITPAHVPSQSAFPACILASSTASSSPKWVASRGCGWRSWDVTRWWPDGGWFLLLLWRQCELQSKWQHGYKSRFEGRRSGALSSSCSPHDHRGHQDALPKLHTHRAAATDFPTGTAW